MQMKHHLETIPLDKFEARCDELAAKGHYLISFVIGVGQQQTVNAQGRLVVAATAPAAIAMFGIPVQQPIQQEQQPPPAPEEEESGPILLKAA